MKRAVKIYAGYFLIFTSLNLFVYGMIAFVEWDWNWAANSIWERSSRASMLVIILWLNFLVFMLCVAYKQNMDKKQD